MAVFSITPEEFVNIRKSTMDIADSVVSSDKSQQDGHVARQSHKEVTHHIILVLFMFIAI